MIRSTLLATALATSVALGGIAYAADQVAPPAGSQETAVQKDAGKLSADGATAFRDVHLARLAIFDANPAKAETLVGQAQGALKKAKTDESVFIKAEADLKPSAAEKQADAAKTKVAPADAAKAAPAKADTNAVTKPIAWLPVDGQLILGEDFVATPQKATAVSEANKTLAHGDRKGAIEKLKLAGVDVDFTMAVLPLDQTTTQVDQAAKLLEQGKYYEANATLKTVEDGLRFDSVDVTGLPQAKAATSAASTGTGTPTNKTH